MRPPRFEIDERMPEAPPRFKNEAARKQGRNRGVLPKTGYWTRKLGRLSKISAGVPLDCHPVVHLVHPKNLGVAGVDAELVVLAHDQRLDRLRRTHLGAQPAEAAA